MNGFSKSCWHQKALQNTSKYYSTHYSFKNINTNYRLKIPRRSLLWYRIETRDPAFELCTRFPRVLSPYPWIESPPPQMPFCTRKSRSKLKKNNISYSRLTIKCQIYQILRQLNLRKEIVKMNIRKHIFHLKLPPPLILWKWNCV